MVLHGTRGLWIGRSIIATLSTLLLASLALVTSGLASLLLTPVALFLACGAAIELIRAARPYSLQLDREGLTLVTPFRRRFWPWQSYEGVVRVVAPFGDKPLSIRVREGSAKPRFVLIGNWPDRIEEQIQDYALGIGVQAPLIASYFRV
jgi:hypothetical protein